MKPAATRWVAAVPQRNIKGPPSLPQAQQAPRRRGPQPRMLRARWSAPPGSRSCAPGRAGSRGQWPPCCCPGGIGSMVEAAGRKGSRQRCRHNRRREQRGMAVLAAMLLFSLNHWVCCKTGKHGASPQPRARPFFCQHTWPPTCASSCSRATSLSAGTAASADRASCSLPLRYRQ